MLMFRSNLEDKSNRFLKDSVGILRTRVLRNSFLLSSLTPSIGTSLSMISRRREKSLGSSKEREKPAVFDRPQVLGIIRRNWPFSLGSKPISDSPIGIEACGSSRKSMNQRILLLEALFLRKSLRKSRISGNKTCSWWVKFMSKSLTFK